jgi:hypothetical protein
MTKTLLVPHARSRWFGGFCALTLLALLCLVPARAFCQAPAQAPAAASPVSDLLDVLLANGTITQAQYDALKQRYEAKHEAMMAAQAAQPAPAMVMPANAITAIDHGVGMHIGRFDLSFSGEINGFYVHDRSDRNSNSAYSDGGCVLCLATSGTVPNSSLRNGLLPGELNIKISTKEAGWDVAVDFGIWPGIESLMTNTAAGMNLNKGQPTGFGTAGIDFRQQYMTFGRRGVGTFKIGRDLGFLGQEAILNDITLFGAGNPNGAGPGNANPGAVTLGRIGLGYIYTDWLPQISYTSPSYRGLQVSGGIFQPLSDLISTTAVAGPAYSAPLYGHGQPQYQIKATYAAPKIAGIKANFWTNYLTQSMEVDNGDLNAALLSNPAMNKVGDSVRANAVDYGVNASFHGFDFVGYGYNGSGVGTEGLLFLATSPSGVKRDSQGYYLQGTYTVAKKWTFGASYGQSNLSLAGKVTCSEFTCTGTNGETATSLSLAKNNGSYVGQVRYGLTSWVNLLGEYTHTRSESQTGLIGTDDAIALGSIAFF